MPLEITATADPFTSLVRFQTSAIYEMIISLQSLVYANRHSAWVQSTQEELGPAFMATLRDLYIPYSYGAAFFELAIDYPDQGDVEGFLAYLRQMPSDEFAFYFTGRLIPLETIQETQLDPNLLHSLMLNHPEYERFLCSLDHKPEQISDIPALRDQVADLWSWYWQSYFCHHVNELRGYWLNAIAEKERWLAHEGGLALYNQVSGKRHFPDPIPADQPFEQVTFIPLYYIPRQAFTFFGYGKAVVFFDASRNESRILEQERAIHDSLETLKALADENRLRILQLIAHPADKYNGKRIAAKLGMTPSTVSRHISQLKAGNLVEEEALNSRSIIYRLKRETISQLPDILLDYIYS